MVYGVFTPNDSLVKSYSAPQAKSNKTVKFADGSIFGVHFLDAAEYQRRLNNDILNNANVSKSSNLFSDKSGKNYAQQTIDDNLPIANTKSGTSSSAPESNNQTESTNNVIINDLDYQRNNSNGSSELSTGFGETVFITDSAQNTLMSCVDEDGAYKCHIALSNLNDPQDILVLRNHLYLINSNQLGESGVIVKCDINNYGYINSCNQQKINIINPIFFYSQGASVYISDFVYDGDGKTKPTSALQCTLDGRGNLINCNPDNNILSMYFISKEYNHSYYHAKSFRKPAAIDKCATIDAVNCIHLTNDLFVYPIALSINHDRFFITNQHADSTPHEVLKCTMDMKKCVIVTTMQMPTAIGVYNFQH